MFDGDPCAGVEPARSCSENLVRIDETPGSVGADHISPPPVPPALAGEALPRGGDEVIPQLELEFGADHVSLAPKIDCIVLVLNGGSPTPAVAFGWAPEEEEVPPRPLE